MATAKIVKKNQKKPFSPKEAGKTTNLKEIEKTIQQLCELFETLTPAN